VSPGEPGPYTAWLPGTYLDLPSRLHQSLSPVPLKSCPSRWQAAGIPGWDDMRMPMSRQTLCDLFRSGEGGQRQVLLGRRVLAGETLTGTITYDEACKLVTHAELKTTDGQANPSQAG